MASTTTSVAHFTPELFRFLRALRKNNDRQWFAENKARYVEHVRDPLLRFIDDFAPHLKRISPHFVADASATGGSMFRIYRDTRFSKDKSPYKTHAAAQFRHEEAGDVHAPGFYLHLEPGEVFIGAGLWRPDSASAARIRTAIDENRTAWRRTISAKPFREGEIAISGESLKRPPRGFDADHPLIADLKRKDFTVVARLDERSACAPNFLAEFAATCRRMRPFMRFVTESMGLSF